MKRIVSIILVLAALLLTAAPVYAALPPIADPQYADVTTATVTLNISTSGKASITMRVIGKSTLTQTSVTTYLEKKVGSTWTRVNIGTTNNNWVYSTANRTFSKLYEKQLSSTGEYRAVCVFTFGGSTTETVTKTAQATY